MSKEVYLIRLSQIVQPTPGDPAVCASQIKEILASALPGYKVEILHLRGFKEAKF
jgi:hypothetical protein